MVGADPFACRDYFLLRLAVCQGKDLIAEARRGSPASGIAAIPRVRPRDRVGAPVLDVLAELVLLVEAPLL
jgi:hypothetical protein